MVIDDKFQKTINNIREFENKYNLDSETFYRKYLTGETDTLRIPDLDSTEWAGEIDIALHWVSSKDKQEPELVTT